MGTDDPMASATRAAGPAARWSDTLGIRGDARFPSTRWTIVMRVKAGSETVAAEAVSQLCKNYWYPLYAYVRRSGYGRESAEDLTQDFFARLVEQEILGRAQPEKGKLRTFLLTVMKRFLLNDRARSSARKRGGGNETVPINFDEGEDRYGHEPADQGQSPDELYEKQWAATLLARVMDALRRDYRSRGMESRYDLLKEALWWNSNETSYAALADQLDMTGNAVKQAVLRLRQQYRKRLSDEIRITLDTDDESAVNEELRHLVEVLRR